MKVYENAGEKAHRFGVFSENLKEIRRHNLSGSSWKKGVNQGGNSIAILRIILRILPSF